MDTEISVLGAIAGLAIILGALVILVTRRGLRAWRFGVFFESEATREAPHDLLEADDGDEQRHRLTWMREKRRIEHSPPEDED